MRRGAGASARSSFSRPMDPLEEIEVTVRVNARPVPAPPFPVGPADVINAMWEPVDPEIRPIAGPVTRHALRR
ncbi:MAG TPA: hypothetical protein VML00_07615 [Bacteroidota bacterium]|nr:hypothetical protein [Bacteroidota bacterium]